MCFFSLLIKSLVLFLLFCTQDIDGSKHLGLLTHTVYQCHTDWSLQAGQGTLAAIIGNIILKTCLSSQLQLI